VNTWKIDATSALQTREEFVTEKLREAILRGHLKPGQRLDQNEIAEALHVSRSPVRDALRTLAVEGLVEVYPHRGAVVAEISPEELEEIYFIRGILEGMAAHLAAPKMDEDRIAVLRDICEKMDKTSDLDQWLELNRRFHHTIYQAAGRPRLLSIIENLRNTSAPYIRQFIATVDHRESARTNHREILEACIDRDGARARQITEEHLKAVCEGALVFVESMLNTA